MSKITIEVDFLAGTDLKDAITEAKQKACFWDVAYVTFSFNGTRFSVSQRADVDKLVSEYDKSEFVVG